MSGDAHLSFDEAWVVWSHEHNAWWQPDERGYTRNILQAGIYSQQRALQIEHNAEPGNEKAYALRDQLNSQARQNNVAARITNDLSMRAVGR